MLVMVAMVVMVVMVRFNIGRWDIKIIVHQMMFCTAFIVMHIVIQSYRRGCHVGVGVDVSKVFVEGKQVKVSIRRRGMDKNNFFRL